MSTSNMIMLHVDINGSHINILDCRGHAYATLKHTKVKCKK